MAIAISNDFLSPIDVISCLQDQHRKVESHLAQFLSLESLQLTNSGSDALFRIFCSLKKVSNKHLVGLPAYCCPHIAIAAGLAGFKIIPLDAHPNSFTPIAPSAECLSECAAIVLPNLFGLPDDLESWRSIVADETLIIDDACQAFLSRRNGICIGAEKETIGVLSFGRGKPLAGVGGGAVVFNSTHTSPEHIAFKVWKNLPPNPALTVQQSSQHLIKALLLWIATNPLFFDLLLKLPIDLGKPDCPETLPKQAPAVFQFSYLAKQLERQTQIANLLKSNSQAWNEELSQITVTQPIEQYQDKQFEVSAIRYPLLFSSLRESEKVIANLRKIGIGATSGYRVTLQDWKPVSRFIGQMQDTPNANAICDRVVLLPNHSGVSPRIIAQAAKAIKSAII